MIVQLAAFVLPKLATNTPTPAEKNPDIVTPGVVGFLTIFAIAIVVVLLVIDMVRRIRRVRYREEVGLKLDAEQAELAQRGGHDGQQNDTADDGDPREG